MLALFNSLHGIIIFESLLLAVVLFRRGRAGNRWLGLFLVALAVQIGAAALIDHGPVSQRFDPRPAVAFLFGPFIFAYVLGVTGALRPVNWLSWLHALPALVMTVHVLAGFEPTPVIGLALYASLVGYLVAATLQYRRFRRRLPHEFSSVEVVSAPWLGQFLLFFALVMVLDFISNFETSLGLPALGQWPYAAVLFALAAFTAFIVQKALAQPEMMLASEGMRGRKYHYSQLSGADLDAFQAQIREHFEAEKPYLREQYGLQDMADELAMTPRELSQTINSRFGQNFAEFIGRYRVIEAQRLLADPAVAGTTILEIMLMAGFNSKSAFNRAFKDVVGVTPSVYRASVGR